MFGDEPKLVSNQEVYDWIKAQGASKAIVHFQGGGDEGGVENIELMSAGETQCIRTLEEFYDDGRVWNSQTRQWDRTRELTLEEKVRKALCKPVYDKYHTFAGEFYVNGTVVWDADKHSCKLSGQESVEHWEDIEEEEYD